MPKPFRFNGGHYSAIVTLDFSKAFDTAQHDILIAKLTKFSFVEGTCDWFPSYLSGRTQSVRYAEYDSESLLVVSGVPQGSILGLLKFTIYVNDLLLALPSTSVLAYADDVTLTAHGDTEESTTANASIASRYSFCHNITA